MRHFILFALLFATPLRAEPLRVVTTVAPIYGVVSDLMRGVTEPALIVNEGTDPHHFSLTPSQVVALNEADIIFAVGGEFEPWLENIEHSLEGRIVHLSELPTLIEQRLPLRELDQIDEHDDDHAEHRTEGHEHHGDYDPHMWLDPAISRVWAETLVATLSETNPENAATYQMNASAIFDGLDRAVPVLTAAAENTTQIQFITSHDSLQYLEHRFELDVVGATSSAMGNQAGARSLSRLQQLEGAICMLTDSAEATTDFSNLFPDWPQVAFDPLGYEFAGQPDYLANLYLSIAAALESCITAP